MAEITTAQVKSLRQKTGAGLADCKKALVESEGDEAKARAWLQARGAALASSKSDRETVEGRIAISIDGKRAAMVAVLVETDFVASNDVFKQFAQKSADALLAAAPADADLASLPCDDTTVEDQRAAATLQIGENIRLGDHYAVQAKHSIYSYIHHDGKTGVLADIDTEDAQLGKNICMHIAAMRPLALDIDGLDKQTVEAKREAYAQVAAESGKPAEIQGKMVDGKMSRYYAETALLKQQYVWDDKLSVEKFLEQSKASIAAFKILQIGSSQS